MATKNKISDEVWDRQAEYYEFGIKHGTEIAMELGVSPQTVSRQMRKRGAVKGAMVRQSIEGLVAMLDRKERRAALAALSDNQRRRKVTEANVKAVGFMVAALLDADKQGDLALAAPIIERMELALGGKHKKRARR